MIKSLFITIALAAGTLAAPSFAADANVCKTSPDAIRSAATSAQLEQAEKALRLVSIGEKLCAAGGRGEASKKFSAAARALGTDMAALTVATNQN